MKNVIETLVGALVLAVAAVFFLYAYRVSGARPEQGYHLVAKFDNVGGVATGSDVRIGGIKVGTVSAVALDPETFMAKLTLTIAGDVSVPADTTAAVVSDGLLGSKYVGLTPGSEETMLSEGGEISITQSSVSIETLIGKFMFNGADGKKEEKKTDASPPDAAPLPVTNVPVVETPSDPAAPPPTAP